MFAFFVILVAGAGSNLHLLPEQVKMVAGTGVDHDLRCSEGHQLPVGAATNVAADANRQGGILSVLFRAAA